MNRNDSEFRKTFSIGILVFDDFEPLDVWGFIEAFSVSRHLGDSYNSGRPYPFKISLIANANSSDVKHKKHFLVKSYNGPRVAVDYFRDKALDAHFDVLMIPGGHGVRSILKSIDKSKIDGELKASQSLTDLLNWIKAMKEKVSIVTSVCTGAAILASTGLLDGRPAATNHQAFSWVASFGEDVLWDNVSRWVDDGKYVTSAGVSAGIDMAFHLVARLTGRANAEAAVRVAEYDWHRDPNQPIYYSS